MNGYLIEKYNTMTGAYTCHRLVEEAVLRGMDLRLVGIADTAVTPAGVLNRGERLEQRDFVVNRFKQGRLRQQLNLLGRRTYNTTEAFSEYINKYVQVRQLRSAAFTIPQYILATPLYDYHQLTQRLGHPFVAKGLESSMGQEVTLVSSAEDYARLRQQHGDWKEWLFEEYIAESRGRDLRLFSIRGQAVACMMRSSQGDFRANVALGATVQAVPITPALSRIASDVYRQTGLDFLGIDLLLGRQGYYFCEVNVMPGLEGIETATGVNVAGLIMDTIKSDFEP